MLIFLNFGGPGGRGWWIGPLISLLPFLLSSGLLTAPLQLLQLLFGIGTTRTFYYDPATQMWRPAGQHGARSSADGSSASSGGGSGHAAAAAEEVEDDGSLLAPLVVALTSMIVTAALTVLLARFTLAARRHGVGRTLRRMLFEGFGGGWGGAGREQGAAGDGGAGRRPVARTRSERIERVANLMQALPLEVYRSREELERMPVAELKRLLEKRGGTCRDCLEKGELVQALLASGNSSASTCTVCCEDYAAGDVLRLLHCGHRFHLECIDRWLLSSTDYSRPPACPICNAELEKVAAGSGASAAGSDSGRA
ncbi:hypothetical protein ABPG75_003346 [Micractinium tetrahymenae]